MKKKINIEPIRETTMIIKLAGDTDLILNGRGRYYLQSEVWKQSHDKGSDMPDIFKQSKGKNELAKIEVKSEGIRIRNCDRYSPLKIDICKDCLKRKGFLVEIKDEEAEQAEMQNKATLKDKLYEILDDLGVAFIE